MEPRLVYRFLRQVSDWVVDGYYSEVVVEGKENVPKHGPLIVSPNHPNEIIDIATLTISMPHQEERFVSYWTMSTMFRNPLVGSFLRASGAIPVVRSSPKSSSKASSSTAVPNTTSLESTSRPKSRGEAEAELSVRARLFEETTRVLAKNGGGVVGLFPEGGSYTGWRIFQVRPGAAWSAVEYSRAKKENGWEGPEVVIVPTAITYTDKSKFLSRVHVRFGEPISSVPYLEELFDDSEDVDPNAAASSVASKMTEELEKRLTEMTVHASDWETICAVRAARQILWTDEDSIRMEDWVGVSQRLADALDGSGDSAEVKDALAKYDTLLQHAGVKHSVLTSLRPFDFGHPLLSLIFGLPRALVRLIPFLPPFLLFLPGYLTGLLAEKVFRTRYEEAKTQIKGVFGGLGVGISILTAFTLLWRAPSEFVVRRLVLGNKERSSVTGKGVQVIYSVGVIYVCLTALWRWHKLLVKENYVGFQRLTTLWKLSRSSKSSNVDIQPYTKPVYPAASPFVKPKIMLKDGSELPVDPAAFKRPRPISASKILPSVLEAKNDGATLLVSYLGNAKNEGLRRYLVDRGANLHVSD
ncbi:hypothetical protein FA15DRAFT_675295 [Coprinopsis marcescibilis]|uniref:Phospholipid/glycerol acyltransferase domain-containing protein n=1 Tax=Coprinopsis marcescibilis TaxID=230819 RepID=A0A5C3KET4_COPMA|nr:hypothetical protein FA15DRAFT_675295 [Coprinopsis marcescibilis]